MAKTGLCHTGHANYPTTPEALHEVIRQANRDEAPAKTIKETSVMVTVTIYVMRMP